MKILNPSRNYWPFGVVTTLVVFAGGLAWFAATAVRQNIDLVRADYYEADLRYQQQFDRLSRAAQLPPGTGVRIDAAARVITVQLPAEHAAQRPTGSVLLYRPADAGLDRELKLETDATGRQEIDARALPAGLWLIKTTWRVGDTEYHLDQRLVIPSRAS